MIYVQRSFVSSNELSVSKCLPTNSRQRMSFRPSRNILWLVFSTRPGGVYSRVPIERHPLQGGDPPDMHSREYTLPRRDQQTSHDDHGESITLTFAMPLILTTTRIASDVVKDSTAHGYLVLRGRFFRRRSGPRVTTHDIN